MRNISQLSKYVWMLGAVLLLCIVSTFYFLPGSSAEAQSDATRQIYLPLVVDHSTSSVGQHVDSNPIIDAEWPTYTSEKGGYSLRYPSDWVAREGIKGTVVITGPSGKWDDKITVIYYDFEKPETDDLAKWAERYFALGFTPDLARTFSKVTLAVKDPLGTSQQVYMQYASPIPGEGYLVTQGRLVLEISTDSADAKLADSLRAVADSVVFADDAPTNQMELSGPDQMPDYITIEAYQQMLDDITLASDAVSYRIQTGEVATHLLAIMSENAKKEYERQLAFAADYIAEADRQRADQASPTPSPTSNPTPNPTPNPGANSDEFFEQERIYNERLKKSALPENKQEGHKQKTPDSSIGTSLEFADVDPDIGPKDIANRRGLPARVTTPIRTYPVNTIRCTSDFHYGKDTYAIDIMVGVGTPVYGTTQNETVIRSETNSDVTGYGMFVQTISHQSVRYITKDYYHT